MIIRQLALLPIVNYGEKYLERVAKSILLQTCRIAEIIFWDNKSTESSKKIADSFLDNKIKYFYASNFTKLYATRNKAIEK